MIHASAYTDKDIDPTLWKSLGFPMKMNADSTTQCYAPDRHRSNLKHLIDSSHMRPKIERWIRWDYGDIKTAFPAKSFLCLIKQREDLWRSEVTVLRINFGEKRRRTVRFTARRVRQRGQNSRYPTDRRLAVVSPPQSGIKYMPSRPYLSHYNG
jgi:hypothetical protein